MVRSRVALEEVTVKLLADVAVPAGVVTVIFPLVVPLAITAVICVALFTTKLEAAFPLRATAVAPVKLLPAITTEMPTCPLLGLKLEMVGAAAVTLKLVADVAVPAGVVTVIFPLVVPLAITAVICVALFTTKLEAACPLRATAVAPVKLLPAITTEAPMGPLPGLKLEIVGTGAVTLNIIVDVAVPAGVVTATAPVVVPLATVAVIWVSLFTVKL